MTGGAGETSTAPPADFARRAKLGAEYMVALRDRLHAQPEPSSQDIETTHLVVGELQTLG